MSTTESTPTVGRWLPNDPDHWWECDGSAPARCVLLHGPSVSACGACGTKRPPMTATPAPRVEDAGGPTRPWGDMQRHAAALRAVPVEGRPLAAAITDHPVSVEDAVKLLREAEQELSGGEGNHEILGAECGVMADRLAALVTPTPDARPLYAHAERGAARRAIEALYEEHDKNCGLEIGPDGDPLDFCTCGAESRNAVLSEAADAVSALVTPTPSEDRP